MREVAREALRLCHFDPETGEDLKHAPRAKEACEAACYDCLLSYYNQRDHRLLDRKAIRDVLLQLAETRVVAGPTAQPRPQHFASLLRQSDSELERQWLWFLEQHGYRLPSHAQQLIASCGTRPDFCYEEYQAVIYVDGPYHDYPERRARDQALTEQLEDEGYLVIRFGARENWEEKVSQFPNIFGRQV